MKSQIEKCFKHYQKEKELFVQNKTNIETLNYQFLKWLISGSVVMCAVSSIIVLFSEGYSNMVFTYGVTALIFAGLYIVYKYVPKSLGLPCFYAFFFALLAYSAYSAAIVYPTYTGVISLGVFVLMPILILDKSTRNILIELIMLAAYLAFVIPRKEWVIHQDEIIYNMSFMIIGLIVGYYLRIIRLENLELVRVGKIRETTDVLTGLYNRRKLFDYFGECESGKVEKLITGISILDIDFFKNYNDTYGHLAGDECLKAVGKCMRSYGKKFDMEFYRYGGEEFVAIAHEQDREKLIRNFENVVKTIENLHIKYKDGVVTISQGVFFLENDIKIKSNMFVSADEKKEGNHMKGYHFQQYLSKADKALYKAKENGRNRTEFN